MRKRIADFSVDFGSIVGLALAGLHPNISELLNKPFTDYFPAVESGLLRIHQTLWLRHLAHTRGSLRSIPLDYYPSSDSHYLVLLTEFLTDPGRAGEHALDGPKCALVAKFLLDCFVPPCSERNFLW